MCFALRRDVYLVYLQGLLPSLRWVDLAVYYLLFLSVLYWFSLSFVFGLILARLPRLILISPPCRDCDVDVDQQAAVGAECVGVVRVPGRLLAADGHTRHVLGRIPPHG